MIMVGKVIVSIIWAFWMMAMSTAEGNPADTGIVVSEPITLSEEYNPTYSSTFDLVNKRGYVICGTNDEFPGFSQNSWNNEDGSRWKGSMLIFVVQLRPQYLVMQMISNLL